MKCMQGLIILSCFSCAYSMQSYRAGVYAHKLIQPIDTTINVGRKQALVNMMKNINVYSVVATEAKSQGVQILVFPENGLYGFDFTREGIQPYLEFVPDPTVEKWNPCEDPKRFNNSEIQQNLSCMAKGKNLYLVANMGDYQPCDVKSDPKCPKDGHYQFNTNVVFSPNGTLLSRYHKTHLFEEPEFDPAPVTEHVFFDTPFGRFGVFICFDILFQNPSIDLIQKYNVTNIVYSAAWWDTIFKSATLFAAMQFHAAFAMGMKVNLLASNIQLPQDGFHGTGIYSANGYEAFYYDRELNTSKLVIADVNTAVMHFSSSDKNSQPSGDKDQKLPENIPDTYISSVHASHNIQEFSPSIESSKATRAAQNQGSSYNDPPIKTFNANIMNDTYTMTIIDTSQLPLEGGVNVCDHDLCCHLDYSNTQAGSNLVAFGAFDGLHTHRATLYLQVCVLLECAGNDVNSCGELTDNSNLYFRDFRISGNFTTNYLFPEILVSNNGQPSLASGMFYDFNQGVLEVINGLREPLISASIVSRDYSRDNTV